MNEDLRQVEATGETVGEAKWAALRELEKLHPGLDKVGGSLPGRVRGRARAARRRATRPRGSSRRSTRSRWLPRARPHEGESELAAEVRDLIERITAGIGVRCRIDIVEDDETLTAACSGSNLGLLIGKHGQTIDAIQYLVNAIVWRARPDDRKDVVVDAAGYRERRRVALESLAIRSAEEALATHSAGRARADDCGRAEDGARAAEGIRRRRDRERGHGAEPVHRHLAHGLTDPRLERWLQEVLETPGLTAIEDRDEAWAMLVEDALRGVEVVRDLEGPIVDVGSGNGSPGIPLAASLPEREVTLLESSRRKCAFLERVAADFPNVSVVCGRAEEQETDRFGVGDGESARSAPGRARMGAATRPSRRCSGALARPRRWISSSSRASRSSSPAALRRAGPASSSCPRSAPTPGGFPRRPGVARKRPLA